MKIKFIMLKDLFTILILLFEYFTPFSSPKKDENG